MPLAKKHEGLQAAAPPRLSELDRVKLVKPINAEGLDNDVALTPGMLGVVMLCHVSGSYEVEFDGIQDVFGIPAEYLEKI